jgi:predicted metal-dependent phosphoesterase TrpH
MHLLGYGIDLNDATLNRELQRLQKARKDRNPGIIERLNHLGFELTLDEVARCAAGGPIGRPHIAGLMVEKGYVDSIDMAFDNYLSSGRPAYVDKYRIPVQAALAAIQGAGGIAILAHPGLLADDRPELLEQLVCELKPLGLGGLEVYYPEHSPAQTARFRQLAQAHTLLMTGGTDFHGQLNPDIQMGCGRGDLHVPLDLYEQLVSALQELD